MASTTTGSQGFSFALVGRSRSRAPPRFAVVVDASCARFEVSLNY